MKDPCLIFDDPRPIRYIWYDGEDAGGWEVGRSDVSKIAAYRENGQMDNVPFYAVYDLDGHIKARVPAHMVTVIYDT